MLVREAGRLVTRESLFQSVWAGAHVEEGSLTLAISVLRKALGDSPSESKYIETVRKAGLPGGYRFVAPVRELASPGTVLANAGPSDQQQLPSGPARQHLSALWPGAGFVLLVALILGGAAWFVSHSRMIPTVMPTSVLLLPEGGIQDDPSFSPDGTQVAFTWSRGQGTSYDIYILTMGESTAKQLTSDPASDESPAWSPDGRQIAFVRKQGSSGVVFLVSPAGGPERKLVDTEGSYVAWTADSKSLALVDRESEQDSYAIFLVSATGGAKRKLTFPAAEGGYGDRWPALSPDGKTLAFVRRLTYDVSDIYRLPLGGGNPRQLTFDRREVLGLGWTPDSRELVFSSNRAGRRMLWRITASPGAQPLPLEGTTQDAQSPAISRARPGPFPRLAYKHAVQDYNIVIMDRALDGTWRTWQPSLVEFIGDEQSPQVSPDGKRLAFTSDRSGWFEIWVGDFPDPRECRKLTSFQQGYVGSPQWSPDSQRIAFDARVNGNADIYMIRADGGQPIRLTHEPSVESETAWSDDGRWVYFRSDRTGVHQIWKMPVEGGDPVQVTRDGGFEALESQDGQLLYYVKDRTAKDCGACR